MTEPNPDISRESRQSSSSSFSSSSSVHWEHNTKRFPTQRASSALHVKAFISSQPCLKAAPLWIFPAETRSADAVLLTFNPSLAVFLQPFFCAPLMRTLEEQRQSSWFLPETLCVLRLRRLHYKSPTDAIRSGLWFAAQNWTGPGSRSGCSN